MNGDGVFLERTLKELRGEKSVSIVFMCVRRRVINIRSGVNVFRKGELCGMMICRWLESLRLINVFICVTEGVHEKLMLTSDVDVVNKVILSCKLSGLTHIRRVIEISIPFSSSSAKV
jgi:hypothetical protein